MSGGSYDYFYFKLQEFADSIRSEGSCYCAPPHVRRAFADLMRKCAAAAKAIEWNDSCDGADDEEALIRACLSEGAPLAELIDGAGETMKQMRAELERANRKGRP